MFVLSQPPTGALSATRCSLRSSPAPIKPLNSSIFSSRKSDLFGSTSNHSKPLHFTLAKAERAGEAPSPAPARPSPTVDETVFVGDENVPLEGVIQFEKPDSTSRFKKWGRVALFAGGDVLALLVFAAIGRFNHGFSVFDLETLKTMDPFVAGWFLSAYVLGGFGEDGIGTNGTTKGITATAKSWALGIPLGLAIRAVTSAHFPPLNFVLVTMGSTGVLLIGWRTLLYSFLPRDKSKKSDVYRRGSPFELFEVRVLIVAVAYIVGPKVVTTEYASKHS